MLMEMYTKVNGWTIWRMESEAIFTKFKEEEEDPSKKYQDSKIKMLTKLKGSTN